VATFSLFFDLSQGIGALVLGGVVAVGGEPAAFAVGAVLCVAGLGVLRSRVPTAPAARAPVDDLDATPVPGA
jgi:hypothetical protein